MLDSCISRTIRSLIGRVDHSIRLDHAIWPGIFSRFALLQLDQFFRNILPGFVSVEVIYFFQGSIGVEYVVTSNADASLVQTVFDEARYQNSGHLSGTTIRLSTTNYGLGKKTH